MNRRIEIKAKEKRLEADVERLQSEVETLTSNLKKEQGQHAESCSNPKS